MIVRMAIRTVSSHPAVSGPLVGDGFLRGRTFDTSPMVGEGVALDKLTIFVLVVEDYEPFRTFIAATFRTQPHLQILKAVSDGAQAVQQAQELQPDLVLLDVGLPTLNGIEVARRIRQLSPTSRILFVSENRSPDVAEEALRAGGLGYVIKSDAAKDLLAAVAAVLQGERFVSASMSLKVLANLEMEASVSGNATEDNVYIQFRSSELIPKLLAAIIEASDADFGNVQLFDSKNGVLKIVAQSGFESEFLRYFDTVNAKEHCACGKALSSRSRIVVEDVARDPIFSGDVRRILLRANVHSIQSTPLIDTSGNLVGMVSTHYRRSGGPSYQMWKRVDDLAAGFLAKIRDVRSAAEKP